MIPKVTLEFIIDDNGWPYYGFMAPYASQPPVGHPKVLTPRMDALASRGALFYWGQSGAPKCMDALQCEMTGKEVLDHSYAGSTNNLDLSAEWVWPRVLRDVGGQRGIKCGKYWEGAVLGGGGFTDQYDAGATADYFGRVSVQPLLDFLTTEVAAGRSCYASAAPRIPHYPFPAQTFPGFAECRALYDTMDWSTEWLAGHENVAWARNWYGMVSWVDKVYGQIEDHLISLGVLDQTLILLWSDNGFALKNSKDCDTQYGRGTPIVAAFPAAFGPFVSDKIVSCIDFYPTILDYNEVVSPAPPLIDGLSMRALLESGGTAQWRRWKPGQWNKIGAPHAMATDLLRADGTPTMGSFYTDQYGTPKRAYDLGLDPGELTNLLSTPQGQAFAAKYTPLLHDWAVNRVPPEVG